MILKQDRSRSLKKATPDIFGVHWPLANRVKLGAGSGAES